MLEIKVAKLEATQNMGAHIFNAFVGGLSHHGPNVPPMPSMRTPGKEQDRSRHHSAHRGVLWS